MRYDYPMSGGYAETAVILDDGQVVVIDTQYERVFALMGQTLPTGLDVAAMVADARINGKFGPRPTVSTARDEAALAKYDRDYDAVVKAMTAMDV